MLYFHLFHQQHFIFQKNIQYIFCCKLIVTFSLNFFSSKNFISLVGKKHFLWKSTLLNFIYKLLSINCLINCRLVKLFQTFFMINQYYQIVKINKWGNHFLYIYKIDITFQIEVCQKTEVKWVFSSLFQGNGC